jgi:DNA-binding response OmpR family regulator
MNLPPLALVVDDDITLRVLAREALDQARLRIEDAATGREAIDAFQRETPQIVLLDVMMSEMDGFAACAAIRRLPQGATVPIMIMTGLDDVESIARAFDAGATDFVTKPWHALTLSHRVRYMLRASQAVDALRENERSLAEAQRISHFGNGQWDLLTNRFTASDEVFHILGVDPSTFGGTMDAYLEPSILRTAKAHCDTIQGYFFSQPLPCDLLEQLVRSNRSRHHHSGPPQSSLPLAS